MKTYATAMAVLIIAAETTQVLTMTGSFDIGNFILNLTGAVIGFIVFTLTPARALLGLRAWQIILIALPFEFLETTKYFTKFSKEDLAVIYGITGGIPFYLSLMDDNASAEEI